MTANTSLNSWPYPEATDPPSGHTQIQALAEAVETSIGDLGAWTAFTPSYTNVTLGTGATNLGKYTQIGLTVVGQIELTLGTGGDVTSTLIVDLPVQAESTSFHVIGTAATFAGAAWQHGACQLNTVDDFTITEDGGTSWNASNPGDWTAGSVLRIQFSYEAAAA